jgi:hypothetical protein
MLYSYYILRGINMKLKTAFTTVIAVLMLGTTCFAQDINVSINGNVVNFTGQKPVIVNGRTLIPLRGVFDSMGYTIGWNGNTKTVTLTKGSDTIVVNIGESRYYLNDKAFDTDVPAEIINGSAMLPLRAIGDATGSEILWDNETKLATIIDVDTAVTKMPQAEVNSASADDVAYITGYSSIIEEYNTSVNALLSVIDEVRTSAASQELQSRLISCAKDTASAAATAKAKLKTLPCPSKYAELNYATMEYMQSAADFAKVLSNSEKLSSDTFKADFQSELSDLLLKQAEYQRVFNNAAAS